MTRSSAHFSLKCPYTYCEELLKSIQFSHFQTYAKCLIDVVCSKSESLSISPHCIAYTSISILMKRYYGLFNGCEPLPFMKLDEREYYLCLNILNLSFPGLSHVCKSKVVLSLDTAIKRERGEEEKEKKRRRVEKKNALERVEKKGALNISPKNHTNQ